MPGAHSLVRRCDRRANNSRNWHHQISKCDSQGLRPGSSLLARTHAEGNLHREIARTNGHLHWALFLHYRARKSKFTNREQLRHRPRRARYPDHNPHYPRLKTHSGSVEERNRREIELAAIFRYQSLRYVRPNASSVGSSIAAVV